MIYSHEELIGKKLVIFDLDGTLAKTDEGIFNSAIHMLNKRGLPVPDRSIMQNIIGPPLRESFVKIFNVPANEVEEAMLDYREYYNDKGIYECVLYDGIINLIAALKAKGKTVALATAKAEPYALRILEHFNLIKYFSVARGSGMTGGLAKKDEILAVVLDTVFSNDKTLSIKDAVMIGDRKHDVIGAKANGIMSIGILHGYGSREELSEAEADIIVNDVAALSKLIL